MQMLLARSAMLLLRFGSLCLSCMMLTFIDACLFGQLIERELYPDEVRNSVLTVHMPIHSYLFSPTGKLLYANTKATARLQKLGKQKTKHIVLATAFKYVGAYAGGWTVFRFEFMTNN